MGKVILAGDIGGTKTHLALFAQGEQKKWLADTKYKSAEFEDLSEIVRVFLNSQGNPQIITACFGIAGPVKGGKSKTTNLPWVVASDQIEKETSIPRVFLINDLEANAHGIDCLEEKELFILNKGVQRDGNRALISAGTGLGEAGIYFDGRLHHPFGSEGGHCSFAPETEEEMELLRSLQRQYGHVSYERILSGPGLVHLYRFLAGEDSEIEDLSPKSITEMGSEGADSICKRALEMFVAIYGGESGNLALQMLAVGGLYIGGGIAPKILNEMQEGRFMKRFVQKGRFVSLLSEIPVKVILNENTALLGALAYARKNS